MLPGEAGRKVVIDAGAAIRLQRLERLGNELYTTSGVLREVRDEHARALLKTLPQEIHVKEPLPQDVAFVKQFAKATGDFGFLSQNDTELIALTVQLHREAGGSVREKPIALTTGQGGSATFDWAPARAEKAGVASAPSAPAAANVLGEPTAAPATAPTVMEVSAENMGMLEQSGLGTSVNVAVPEACPVPTHIVSVGAAAAVALSDAAGHEPTAAEDADEGAPEEAEDQAEDGDESADGSSAGEWVTPDNMHRFGVAVEASFDVKVTCATADYSVQNVLLQMGITPLTFDGYAVRSVKLWGLVCRACFLFTRETQKVFCPKCGHDTLVRVPIVVDQDGKPTALNSGRKLRTKGTVYSVPKPQGGRGWKPIFAEDELRMGGRDRELRRLENLHNKERQSRDPFNEDNAAKAWWQRSTTSTGKVLDGEVPRVQAGYGRRNPNANNFRGFGRKKR